MSEDEKIAGDAGIDLNELKAFTNLSADLMKQMTDGFAKMVGVDPAKVAAALIIQAGDDNDGSRPDFVQANCCLHCAANAMMAHHVERVAAKKAQMHDGNATKH